jgi:hypothetical protein
MSRGAGQPRGASTKYWVITALVTWLLLIPPPPFDLLAFGWLVYRVRKYMNDRRREQSRLVNKLNTRLVNLLLKNNKQLINVEITGEDDGYIKLVDNTGKELMVDKSYIAVIEPVQD